MNRETRGKRQSEYNAEEPLFENKYGSTLAEFFKDNAARRALDNPLEPFAPPSADTKTAFEALTSAINVTPTDDGSYNITQIKEDAVWLSNEAKVDEITALRLVVLEWQSRARAQLLSTGNAAGSQAPEDSFGNSLNKSAFLAGARAQTQDALLFNTSNERRARLLRIYLEGTSERAENQHHARPVSFRIQPLRKQSKGRPIQHQKQIPTLRNCRTSDYGYSQRRLVTQSRKLCAQFRGGAATEDESVTSRQWLVRSRRRKSRTGSGLA